MLGINDKWVPFATAGNGEGGAPTVFMLDCDPPPGVEAGRVIAFGGEGDALALWAPDLLSLLQDVQRVLVRRYGGHEEEGSGNAGAAAASAGSAAGGKNDEDDDGEGEEEEQEGEGEEEHPPAHAHNVRHFKVLFDDGPRIWHQYMSNDE